ncbi:MAG: DUF2635 domain-containing protein [Planctomycetota bacterium]
MATTNKRPPATRRLRPGSKGLVVRVPGRQSPLAAAGEEVALDTYWRRRLRAGDVVEVGERRAPNAKRKPVADPEPAQPPTEG